MAVLVRPLNILGTIGGGAPPGTTSTQFVDNFTRANNNNPGNYTYGMIVGTGNNVVGAVILSNKLRTSCTGISGSARSFLAPLPLAWMTQVQQNQFSEMTLSAQSTTTWDAGPICVLSPNPQNGANAAGFYYLAYNPASAGALTIERAIWVGGDNQPTFTALQSTGSAVLGDTIRLTATVAGGVWTLTTLKNGVVLGSTTDNQLSTGMPGMLYGATGNTTTIDTSHYAAGTM